MLLSRKSPLLLSGYATLPSLSHGPSAAEGGSWTCRHRCQAHPRRRPSLRHAHHDAAHSHSHSHSHSHTDGDGNVLQWPEAVKPHATPTPYQILQCAQGDVYSKHRYYALVKLYHPDRCHSASPVAHLPRHVRLDRYRMLVAAHVILSDADKRRAYDAWGHGWAGHHAHHAQPQRDWEYDTKRWATDPRNNATWEDWERWHAENAASSQAKDNDQDAPRTVQMSNLTFMALLFAVVSIGSVVQGSRFTNFNTSVLERREQIHREASLELRRSQDTTLLADRRERIRTFVQHRDSNVIGEQAYQRILPPAADAPPAALPRQ